MKSILIIVLVFSAFISKGQSAGEAISQKISQKMKDSLSLTQAQADSIYNMSLRIHDEKVAMLNQYKGTPQLPSQIRAIENKRDSLYKTVLSELTFSHYMERKRFFVLNN